MRVFSVENSFRERPRVSSPHAFSDCSLSLQLHSDSSRRESIFPTEQSVNDSSIGGDSATVTGMTGRRTLASEDKDAQKKKSTGIKNTLFFARAARFNPKALE